MCCGDYLDLISNFPNYLNNLENCCKVKETLSKICSIFCHENFVILPIFNDIKFIDLLTSFLNFGGEEAIYILKIVGNIWYHLDKFNNCFTDKKLVRRVCQCCSNFGAPDILPFAFFAIANFYGISREARIDVMEMDLKNSLLRFLRSYSRNQHLKAGLRLLNNLFLYDDDHDDDNFNVQVIPILRCHLMYINPEIRVLSAKCLNYLLLKRKYLDKMIEYDVPENIAICLIESNNKRMYLSEIFDSAYFFVKEGICEYFLTFEFIDSIRIVLNNEQMNVNFYSLFKLFSILIPKIYETFNKLLFEDILPLLCEYSLKSVFQNKIGACLCISKILELSTTEVKLELAEKGVLEAFIIILENENETDLCWLLYHIYNIICLDCNRFKQVCYDNHLLDIISEIVCDNEYINTYINLIIDLLKDD